MDMNRLISAVVLGAATMVTAFGQGSPGTGSPLQKFEGTGSQTTTSFNVGDQWEVRWAGLGMNLSVLAADNSVVAGAVGFRGALYVPKGGTYHLQIDYIPFPGVQMPAPHWSVEVLLMNSLATQAPSTLPNYALPTGSGTSSSPLAAITPSNAPAAPASPFGSPVPPTPVPPAPVPASAPAPTVNLTGDQARAVVLIKGDNAEGTGFMIKTPAGPVVITNIHVIANNPNIKVTTSTGALVSVLSEKGASDRDLAMLTIQDAGYSYLQLAPDISTVAQPGDEVITPGNSQGGEVMLNTAGKVLGIGPQRVEIDNPIYHGNSGGPVFHTKSGKVLGVVTEAMKVDMSNDLDKASFASRNSAISGSMRYFALRLDTVPQWVPIESRRFQIETTFLDQFEDQSQRLDSFLNSSDKGSPNNTSSDDAKLYLTDDKIMKANNDYETEASGADTAQRIQALREMLFELESIADSNMDQISTPQNFYSFDQERAQGERDYRKALRAELDSIGNNIERLGSLPRTNASN